MVMKVEIRWCGILVVFSELPMSEDTVDGSTSRGCLSE